MRIGTLASRLACAGHRVTWWASTFSHFLKEPLANGDQTLEPQENLTLRMLEVGGYAKNISLARLRHHWRFAKRLGQEFRRQDPPDLIICCYPIMEACYAALQYGREFGVPVIVDVRDVWPDAFLALAPPPLKPLAKLFLWPYFWLAQRVLPRADGLSACSQGFLDWALAYAERPQDQRDRVIYHGYPPFEVSSKPLRPELQDLIAPLQGKTVFTYSGSFSAIYNLRTVCEAAAQLQEREDVHFLLVGKGTMSEQIEALAQPLSNVTLTGWVNQSDLSHLLQASHVGLVPWDGPPGSMPNKVFECLAASLPILGSIEGDLEALLAEEQLGYSYPAKDSEALARLVTHMADDKIALREMAERAGSVFEERFSREVTFGGFQSYLERMARG